MEFARTWHPMFSMVNKLPGTTPRMRPQPPEKRKVSQFKTSVHKTAKDAKARASKNAREVPPEAQSPNLHATTQSPHTRSQNLCQSLTVACRVKAIPLPPNPWCRPWKSMVHLHILRSKHPAAIRALKTDHFLRSPGTCSTHFKLFNYNLPSTTEVCLVASIMHLRRFKSVILM